MAYEILPVSVSVFVQLCPILFPISFKFTGRGGQVLEILAKSCVVCWWPPSHTTCPSAWPHNGPHINQSASQLWSSQVSRANFGPHLDQAGENLNFDLPWNFQRGLPKVPHSMAYFVRVLVLTYLPSGNISLSKRPILILHSASADKSAAKYSEMSAILGFLGHIRPP